MSKALLISSLMLGLLGCELTESTKSDPDLDLLKGGFEVYGDHTKRAGIIFKNDSMTYRYWDMFVDGGVAEVVVKEMKLGGGVWRKSPRDTLAKICPTCVESADSVYVFRSSTWEMESVIVYNLQKYANDSITMNYRILRPFSNHIDSNLLLRGRYFGAK